MVAGNMAMALAWMSSWRIDRGATLKLKAAPDQPITHAYFPVDRAHRTPPGAAHRSDTTRISTVLGWNRIQMANGSAPI